MSHRTDIDSPDLTRRRLVQRAAVGAAAAAGVAGVTLGARTAAATESASARRVAGTDYDVIVIGGGNAGAAAARDSMKNGYRTLLLEARNRLGGRTFTAEFDGDHVELGGFWIHHTQPFVWAEKERYKLEIVETPGAVPEQMVLVAGGKRIVLSADQVIEAATGWQAFTGEGREILPRGWDLLHNRAGALAADGISAIDKLNTMKLTPLQQAFNRAVVATMAHNRPETMSWLEVLRWHQCGGGYFPTFMDSVGRFSLKDGTIALVNAMIADGAPEVRLSTPVRTITDRGDRVVVTTQAGETITAAAVICCLPMNTISDIAFDPGLPAEVVAAGRERHTGSGVKLYMKIKGRLGLVQAMSDEGPLDFVMTYKQAVEYTLLVGFAHDAQRFDAYDDAAVQTALQALIPGAQLIASMSYDWNSDPWARGTYCSYRPGWVAKYYPQFQRDQGRVLFGSSDHGEGWRGFIDGAIGGGIRAAQRVKALLG